MKGLIRRGENLEFIYKLGVPRDGGEVIALLPRLAEFNHPERLVAEDFWRSDVETVRRWQRGDEPKCFVMLARLKTEDLVGAALVRMMPEVMSRRPSCHLEALVVDSASEGYGVGAALIAAARREAKSRGALSMTLNVFETNHRARSLYDRLGFYDEIHRCISVFDD